MQENKKSEAKAKTTMSGVDDDVIHTVIEMVQAEPKIWNIASKELVVNNHEKNKLFEKIDNDLEELGIKNKKGIFY